MLQTKLYYYIPSKKKTILLHQLDMRVPIFFNGM